MATEATSERTPFRLQLRGRATGQELKLLLAQLKRSHGLDPELLGVQAPFRRPAKAYADDLVAEHLTALKLAWTHDERADLVWDADRERRLLLAAGDGDVERSFRLARDLRQRLRVALLRELGAFRAQHLLPAADPRCINA